MGEGALVRPKDLVGDVSGDTIPSRSESSFRYAAKGMTPRLEFALLRLVLRLAQIKNMQKL